MLGLYILYIYLANLHLANVFLNTGNFLLVNILNIAGQPGLEPGLVGLEATILPLNYCPIYSIECASLYVGISNISAICSKTEIGILLP